MSDPCLRCQSLHAEVGDLYRLVLRLTSELHRQRALVPPTEAAHHTFMAMVRAREEAA